MKIKIIFLLIGSILFIQSCASTRPAKLAAIASTDQKVGFEETIISRKKHSVSLAPYEELDVAKDKTLFMLGIQNNGDTSFDIGYDNITVYFQESDMTFSAGRMWIQTYEDFMADLIEEQSTRERKYIRDGLRDILSEFMRQRQSDSLDASSGSSGQASVSGSSGQASVSGISGQASVSGISDQASVNGSSGEPPRMVFDLVDSIKTMRNNDRQLREAMAEIVMKPRTVMSGGAYSGIVVCNTHDPDPKIEGYFQIIVSVDGEEHKFTFKRSSNKQKD